MRRYPTNSPQAAARVVALSLLADGAVTKHELASLSRFDVYTRLGVDNRAMQVVLEDFARDLYEFGVPAWDHTGGLHHLVVQCVLEDVTDPVLRGELFNLCNDIAQADNHLLCGELAVLRQTGSEWQLPVANRLN